MLENVELFELFVVETKLLYKLRIAQDQERSVTDICQICSLIRVLLKHVLDKFMTVTVLLYTLFLHSIESGKWGDVDFETWVHFL